MESLDKKILQEDMKAIRRGIPLVAAGAILTGALLANALHFYVHDEIELSISQAVIAVAPVGVIYHYLRDAYSRINRYMSNGE